MPKIFSRSYFRVYFRVHFKEDYIESSDHLIDTVILMIRAAFRSAMGTRYLKHGWDRCQGSQMHLFSLL